MQPDDEAVHGDDDALYINFSDDEAASESRDMEPLPTGKYLVTITDCELRESQSERNPGKPYYAVEFTVVEDRKGGQFVNRKCWGNAMLFKPALFTITHIMKACGFVVQEGRVRIPKPGELIGQTLVVGGLYVGEKKDKNDPSKTYAPKFEPKSYFPADKWTQAGLAVGKTTASGGRSSLLS